MFFHQPASTHHAFIPACGSPLSWMFASIASCWEEFAKHIPPHEAAIGNSPFCLSGKPNAGLRILRWYE